MTAPPGARLRLVADPYPPYQYDAAGAVEGLDQERVLAAFAAAGVAAETELMGWSQCLDAIREERADAIFQITPNPEREGWLAFSAPFREARTVAYRRRADGPERIGKGGLAELAGTWPVGSLAGFSYHPSIDAVAGKVEFGSDPELLEALRQGVVDVAVVDEGVALHLLEGEPDLTPIEGFATTRPLHLASRLDRAAVVDTFDSGLSRLGASAGA